MKMRINSQLSNGPKNLPFLKWHKLADIVISVSGFNKGIYAAFFIE